MRVLKLISVLSMFGCTAVVLGQEGGPLGTPLSKVCRQESLEHYDEKHLANVMEQHHVIVREAASISH